jgi:omega-6 fatty acid desaturase (delta-12 desaturase)
MTTITAEDEFSQDAVEEDIPQDAAYWRELLAPYMVPRLDRSVIDVLTSAVAYVLVCIGMVLCLRVSAWLVLALSPLAAVCALRTFIVFHDCSHGSFLPWRRANVWLGTLCGVLVLSPFVLWRHDHAVHHASAGDLDRRGIGDVPMLTVEEYHAKAPRARLAYRLFRCPAVMFGIGPIVAMIIGPRLISRNAPRRMIRSVLGTDLAIGVLAAALIYWIGIPDLLLIWGPPALIAGALGIWLFYVQHQFEDVYWRRSERWSYADAALRGSSFLRLPAPLRFATGNIGYHHVHHLAVRIPNYNLKRAHDENPVFDRVPVLTIRQGLHAPSLKLWDEHAGRMVTFAQARALAVLSSGGSR